MRFMKPILEGIKLAALLAAVALVVWSMPDYGGPYTGHTANAASSVNH